jgi:predicted nuclease with RNAse H fold
MHYCGVVPARGLLQLAMLEEVRRAEPPIRLAAVFYEPGSAAQIEAELTTLGEVVVAIGAPTTETHRARDCDERLHARGIPPARPDSEALRLARGLAAMGVFRPPGDGPEGVVPEGAFREAGLFETNADAVFCALQARRIPAKRHPHGLRLRIDELLQDQIVDDGGGLWQRRIEEVDAAGAALCAHRYAVGHASWLGDPDEGVVVVPGASIPQEFSTAGVLGAVERLKLPRVG